MELRVNGPSKKVDSDLAVDDVSFEVERGRFLTLLRPSGFGKTTLFRCVAGVETPDAGTIEIGVEVVFSNNNRISMLIRQVPNCL